MMAESCRPREKKNKTTLVIKIGVKTNQKNQGGLYNPSKSNFFPIFGLHQPHLLRGEGTAPSQPSGTGTKKSPTQFVFSKTFCSGSTKRQGNQAITHQKCIYITHKEFSDGFGNSTYSPALLKMHLSG